MLLAKVRPQLVDPYPLNHPQNYKINKLNLPLQCFCNGNESGVFHRITQMI